MKNKIISFILALSLILSFAQTFAFASESDAVTVMSAGEFMQMADNPSGNYILGADIDLSGYQLDGSLVNEFSGTLDGNGHRVKNINIVSDKTRVALFDTVTGTVKNIKLYGNVNVTSDFTDGIAVAAVAVSCNSGKLEDIISYVDITVLAPQASVGGIVAISQSEIAIDTAANINRCENYGDITVGRNNDTLGGTFYAGGIAASATRIAFCINGGKITVGDELTSNVQAAGIVAHINRQAEYVSNYNSGTVVANAVQYAYAGGISAFIGNGYPSLQQSENSGSITAAIVADAADSTDGVNTDNVDSKATAGGIAAYTNQCAVINCKNTGFVSATKPDSSKATTIAGGIVGAFEGMMLKNCLDVHSKEIVAGQSGSVCGKLGSSALNSGNYYKETDKEYTLEIGTAVSQSTQQTYAEFDFEKIWTMGADGYPKLVSIPVTQQTDWSFDEQTGTLTVCTDLGDFVSKGTPWHSVSKNVKSIVVEQGVQRIGNWTFAYCYNAKTVCLPQSLVSIGSAAFNYCQNVISMPIPDNVQTISNSAFANCYALQEVNIPLNIKTVNKYTFSECRSLKTVNYSGTNEQYSTIKILSGNDCLTSVYPPQNDSDLEWKIEDGTLIISGNAKMPDYAAKGAPWYERAKEIKAVVVEEGVKSIGAWAFGYLFWAESIEIADSVKSIGVSSFYRCAAVKELVLPTGLTTLSNGAFSYCLALESINIPSAITTIKNYTFSSCTSLKTVTGETSKLVIGTGNEALIKVIS